MTTNRNFRVQETSIWMTKSLSDINMRGNIESLFNISLMIIFCGNGAEMVSAKIIWFSLTLLIQTVNSQFEM